MYFIKSEQTLVSKNKNLDRDFSLECFFLREVLKQVLIGSFTVFTVFTVTPRVITTG